MSKQDITFYVKFWVFIYKRTGFIHSSLKVLEYEYLLKKIPYIEKLYLDQLDDEDRVCLEHLVDIEIGMFQMGINLSISSKYMEWSVNSKYEIFKIRVKRLLGV